MAGPLLPRYPIYIPSKGRAGVCLTPHFLLRDAVPFKLVVEPQQAGQYGAIFGDKRLLVLPFRDRGLFSARNWIKDHATAAGYERHWQLDDNIAYVGRRYKGKRIPCDSGIALAAVEDFVDRYENVAVAGLAYEMFLHNGELKPPFFLNVHVYSFTLVLNAIPQRWRLLYNDDTDFCLQVLAGGWCTILFNAFYAWKKWTMQMPGGNTTDLYQGDGRLRMARSLERVWPGVVSTGRRYHRPQHVIKDSWRKFDTPLRLRPGLDPASLPANEYGLRLEQVKPIRSTAVRRLRDGRGHGPQV